jgi:hypothetical protein
MNIWTACVHSYFHVGERILAFAMCHVYVGYALNDDSDNESTPDNKAIPFKLVLGCEDIINYQSISLNYQMTNKLKSIYKVQKPKHCRAQQVYSAVSSTEEHKVYSTEIYHS